MLATIIYYTLFVWYLVVLLISGIGVYGIFRRTRKVENLGTTRDAASAEPVTVLRPLKGVDPQLYDCLRSSFVQTYPFELIFCVAEPDDKAIPIVQQLLAEFPYVDAKILIGNESYGPNPKINNLAKGYAVAKNDLLWVLDSNVWVSPNTLGRAVARFSEDNVSLVHHLPMAVALGDGYGSRLEEMYLLTAHSKFYTGINDVGVAPCVCGKSNLYHRSALDKAVGAAPGTGIQKFALYISEDQMIAEALWGAGGRTRLTNEPAIQPLADSPAKAYIDRRVRWLRVRKYMVIAATLVEPTTESILSGLIGAFAGGNIFFGGFSWRWLLIHLLVWCAVDYFNFNNLLEFSNIAGDQRPFFTLRYFSPNPRAAGKPRSLIEWVPMWAFRELLALPIWSKAMAGSELEWRNRPFRIRPDLIAEELPSTH